MFTKEFWHYFFNTYKNAKWLVIRYLIVAIYLTVSSIIANQMNLDNLTYYNAIIAISTFGTLIGFGISNGVGIFINQNIKNKKKAEYYIKIGFYLNAIISSIFTLLLLCFYKFILHSILGLPININYDFYFYMTIYIFLNCLFSYLRHILKTLKLFKLETVTAVIEFVLIIGGFLLVWFFGNLSLTLISLIYILTIICTLMYSFFALYKNKTVSVNLFKLVKLELNRQETVIIWRMAAMQIVWQIGYTMLSLFLLKVSEVIFDQYAYFENILDIFNGFFFAFVSLTSIEICRNLGEGNFNLAFKHGKYSLYSTIVIWFAYFVLCSAFIIPIITGMNIELRDTALISMFLYITIHLFRFLSWNLLSYILTWGGELKLILWQEVIFSLYFVLFYLIANLIPANIYLIYLIISIPPIFQTILGVFIFLRKKWMKKLSDG